MKFLKDYFDFDYLGTNLGSELLAGVSVFLSISYIFIVNPSILGGAGFDTSAVCFATVVTSAAATFFMGVWGRLPFVLAPGLEMNAFVAYVLIGGVGVAGTNTGLNLSWQQALGAVFWSGCIFVILTYFFTNFREAIINAINVQMKLILVFSVGVFVFVIGLQITGMTTYDDSGFVGIGELWSAKAQALYIGIVLLMFLKFYDVPGSILMSILISAFYLNVTTEIDPLEEFDMSNMLSAALKLDFGLDLELNLVAGFIGGVFLLFVVDFYGSVAKFIALTENIPEVKIKEKAPRALQVDGAATMVGALLGTSSVTTFVESQVGIGAGGKSGLTAVVCSVLMLSSLLLLPFLVYVPVAATAPALIYVGWMLFPIKVLKDRFSTGDWLLLAVCGLIVWFLFSLDIAMLVGFSYYVGRQIVSRALGDASEVISIPLLISILLLLVSRILA